jgi:hypothetical protein
VRGFCYYHQPDESYGFFAYLDHLSPLTWLTDPRNPESPYKAVFFHDSALPQEVNPARLPSRRMVFEFEIGQSERGVNAENIRLLGSKGDSGSKVDPGNQRNAPEPTWKPRLVE